MPVNKNPTVKEIVTEIRTAVANYMYSEGCSCCEDIDQHAIDEKRLAKLLDIEPYDDGSGYDFYKYCGEGIGPEKEIQDEKG